MTTLRYGDGYRDQRPDYRAMVKQAQILLTEKGYATTIDGYFGPQMRKAVWDFQRHMGLTVDGIIGPKTWEALTAEKTSHSPGTGNEVHLKSRGELIVSIAQRYIGQHEKPRNSGFVDAEFERVMRNVGWFKGAAWCDFFCEAVWTEAYADVPKVRAIIAKIITGGTLRSFRAFQESKLFTIDMTPVLGAIGYYKHTLTTGHAVIVSRELDVTTTGPESRLFGTIEGNSNVNGAREGTHVVRRDRPIYDKRLLGFIHPLEM